MEKFSIVHVSLRYLNLDSKSTLDTASKVVRHTEVVDPFIRGQVTLHHLYLTDFRHNIADDSVNLDNETSNP